VSSSTLFLDPDLRVHHEDHSDRLLYGMFGGLIRMLAPPRLDTRPVTFHRGRPERRADSNALSTASAVTFRVGSIFDSRQTMRCSKGSGEGPSWLANIGLQKGFR
jgi:hypothetical protein